MTKLSSFIRLDFLFFLALLACSTPKYYRFNTSPTLQMARQEPPLKIEGLGQIAKLDPGDLVADAGIFAEPLPDQVNGTTKSTTTKLEPRIGPIHGGSYNIRTSISRVVVPQDDVQINSEDSGVSGFSFLSVMAPLVFFIPAVFIHPVMLVFGCLLGVGFGIAALDAAKSKGMKGKALAIFGILLSLLGLVLFFTFLPWI